MTLEQQSDVPLRERGALVAERAPSEVQNEGVLAEHVAIACRSGSQAQIVFLAVAEAEDRIEVPDRIEERAPDVEAEADAGGQIGIRGHRGAFERRQQRLEVAVARPRIVDAETRQRADLRVVREGRD